MGNEKKIKFTISLSKNDRELIDELRIATDAYTDSEVVRNALREHAKQILMKTNA